MNVAVWVASVLLLLALGVARGADEDGGAAQVVAAAIGTAIAALVIGWVIWAVLARVRFRRRKPPSRLWIPAIAVIVGALSTMATLGSES